MKRAFSFLSQFLAVVMASLMAIYCHEIRSDEAKTELSRTIASDRPGILAREREANTEVAIEKKNEIADLELQDGKSPTNAVFWLKLGDIAVELGDCEAAREHYQKARDYHTNSVIFGRLSHISWLTGDERKARWFMQKAIDSAGSNLEGSALYRVQLAFILWQGGALLPAEKQAENAFHDAPKNCYVLAVMGRIKTAQKQFDEAIRYYEKSVEIVPGYFNLAPLVDLYLLKGNTAEADRCLLQIHGLRPLNTVDYSERPSFLLGSAEAASFDVDHKQDLDGTLHELEKTYSNFKNVFVTDALAWCYYKKSRYAEARKTIQKALRWKTPDANILFHAGMIHWKLGEREMAKQYLNRALSLNPYFHIQNAELAATTLAQIADSGARP